MYHKVKDKIILGDFTFLEIILVVVIIVILAGIFVLIFNPGQKLVEARNARRNADANAILNAVYQYITDNKGVVPKSIIASSTEICKTGKACGDLIDLSFLTSTTKYFMTIPVDPAGVAGNGTGYYILRAVNGSVTVTAPHAEQGVTISATR
ncbi:MAG: hypothetical protein PHN39_02845 [Candidatus Pacebacteria bacterium]|nr:hypothetical protein [Candidatus Paceibacterota bacterium]